MTPAEYLGGTFGEDWDLLVARSTDNGATWSAPAALNNNAFWDKWDDMGPQVTTDKQGNWVAVWRSNDGLGNLLTMISTRGVANMTDADILFARGTIKGRP